MEKKLQERIEEAKQRYNEEMTELNNIHGVGGHSFAPSGYWIAKEFGLTFKRFSRPFMCEIVEMPGYSFGA